MWRVYRVPHLLLDQLPPLSEREAVAHGYLRRSAGALDPAITAKRERLFFAFLRVFRVEPTQELDVALVRTAVRLAESVGVS
ncbi:hypothetical protein PsYK624_158780 [Phanerochaete sordida]|uniref:Uncharacterized protein n=1 Tax=Phanerochaete sordida TaxID=48140 RepID=A0A9P3GRA0_9APHY|nr:hypothetical protein PsYK624_158780 [Phanerochaete sordida]